jgi:hypothetical protein
MDLISESMRIMIFKIAYFLIGLLRLMTCTHDLTIVVAHSDTVAKALSTNISIVLTKLVYLQKMDKSYP